MKDVKAKPQREMLLEYDFSRGTRGKYAKRHAEGTNVVLLDPDVAQFFSDSKSVNSALRALMGVARRQKAKPTTNK